MKLPGGATRIAFDAFDRTTASAVLEREASELSAFMQAMRR